MTHIQSVRLVLFGNRLKSSAFFFGGAGGEVALCRLGECSVFVEGLFLVCMPIMFLLCVLEKECDWYPGSGIQSLYQILDGDSSLLHGCYSHFGGGVSFPIVGLEGLRVQFNKYVLKCIFCVKGSEHGSK